VDPATKRLNGEHKRDKTSQSGMSQMLKEFMKKASHMSTSRMTIGATMQDVIVSKSPIYNASHVTRIDRPIGY
jgi:hypothetical protein